MSSCCNREGFDARGSGSLRLILRRRFLPSWCIVWILKKPINILNILTVAFGGRVLMDGCVQESATVSLRVIISHLKPILAEAVVSNAAEFQLMSANSRNASG